MMNNIVTKLAIIAALMMSLTSITHANTGDQATAIPGNKAAVTVNPGEEPESKSGRAEVEGNANEIGLSAVYCESCPNHTKYIRLSSKTAQADDLTFYKKRPINEGLETTGPRKGGR